MTARGRTRTRNRVKPELTLNNCTLRAIYSALQAEIDALPESIPQITVDEFAEQRRIMPPGTPYSGPWRTSWTPYLRAIMHDLSAESEVEEVIWIKCSQIGATATVENWLGYIIALVPGPTLYCTSKEDLLRKWVSKRFDPMIKSYKLESRLYKQFQLQGQKGTGNTQFSKEFPGGALDLISAQSESNLRMDSIRYLILDEAGAYPQSVQGFGDPIAIARARTANWGSRKKIFIPSTPGVEGKCRMWDLFLEGDQRRYHVPCPKCGKRFVLKFPSEPLAFYRDIPVAELRWHARGSIVDKGSPHVECPHCRAEVYESSRYTMMQAGEWIPTASPNPKKHSYQIGRLYSLMDTWERLAQEEINCASDPLRLQTHHNHNCGIPYRELTSKPEIIKIYQLRGTYRSGVIPCNDVLFLTAAVDVQRGSEKDTDTPPRLELEVCGHGIGYRTWSILYKTFVGPVTDAYAGAWEDFFQWMKSGGFIFKRNDGLEFGPRLVFVDSQDTYTESAVYDFCDRNRGFLPIRGARELQSTSTGKATDQILDEPHATDRDRWREHKRGDSLFLLINTHKYKEALWKALKVPKQDGPQQRPRFCEFPQDYPDKYFDMLVAEERRADGSFWRPASRPNEALDLRVYNMCAGEYWIYLEVQRMRAEARRLGQTREQSEFIKSRHILAMYEKQISRKLDR